MFVTGGMVPLGCISCAGQCVTAGWGQCWGCPGPQVSVAAEGGRAVWGSQHCLLPQDRDVIPCRNSGVERSQSNHCRSLATGMNRSRRRPAPCQAVSSGCSAGHSVDFLCLFSEVCLSRAFKSKVPEGKLSLS